MRKLLRGELLRISEGLGCEIRVTEGSVWITQHHDSADYIVEAGGAFRINRRGVTLVTATKAVIELREPVGAPAMELAHAA